MTARLRRAVTPDVESTIMDRAVMLLVSIGPRVVLCGKEVGRNKVVALNGLSCTPCMETLQLLMRRHADCVHESKDTGIT